VQDEAGSRIGSRVPGEVKGLPTIAMECIHGAHRRTQKRAIELGLDRRRINPIRVGQLEADLVGGIGATAKVGLM
jgi:hypothetical protein